MHTYICGRTLGKNIKGVNLDHHCVMDLYEGLRQRCRLKRLLLLTYSESEKRTQPWESPS